MYYGNLKKCDIANGVGVRVTLFVSGCTNHCPDCFQPQTWDFHYGKPFTDDTRAEIFAELDKPYINGLTVLGGEPFEPENQRDLLPLLQEVRRRYPDQEHLVLHRLPAGGRAAAGGGPSPVPGNGPAALVHRRAGGRTVRGGGEGHQPAVPGQPEPAGAGPAQNPGRRGSRWSGSTWKNEKNSGHPVQKPVARWIFIQDAYQLIWAGSGVFRQNRS